MKYRRPLMTVIAVLCLAAAYLAKDTKVVVHTRWRGLVRKHQSVAVFQQYRGITSFGYFRDVRRGLPCELAVSFDKRKLYFQVVDRRGRLHLKQVRWNPR